MSSSWKSNLLLPMNIFNHISMDEFIENRQEIGKLLDVKLVDIDDIKQEA